jgi:hypothetical protein
VGHPKLDATVVITLHNKDPTIQTSYGSHQPVAYTAEQGMSTTKWIELESALDGP